MTSPQGDGWRQGSTSSGRDIHRPQPLDPMTIAEAKRVSLLTVASWYPQDLPLVRQGTRFVCLCPFHAETGPSFTVWLDTNTWKCFGCHLGGDSIALVRQLEDCSFRAAVERLVGPLDVPQWDARRSYSDSARSRSTRHMGSVSATDPVSTPGMGSASARPAALLDPPTAIRETLTVASLHYALSLWESPEAQAYLAARGITEELALHECLGYCQGTAREWQAIQVELHQRGLPARVAWDAGLLVRDGVGWRQRFGGYLLIPEIRHGEAVWLLGRRLDVAPALPRHALGSDQRQYGQEPERYLNVPGPRPLLGAESIAGQEVVIAVEGAFDRLTLLGWRLPVCSTLGTELSADARFHLARAQRIYLPFDGDNAGQQAIGRLGREMTGRVWGVILPRGQDPNDLGCYPRGRELFLSCLDAAQLVAPNG